MTRPPSAYQGTEDAFQRTAIGLVRIIARSAGIDERAVMHVPNGGRRDKATGAKLKGMGVVAGYPDIMVFASGFHDGRDSSDKMLDEIRGNMAIGLAIELKVWPNKPTEAQKAIHGILRAAGWRVAVCWSLDEVEDAANDYLNAKHRP